MAAGIGPGRRRRLVRRHGGNTHWDEPCGTGTPRDRTPERVARCQPASASEYETIVGYVDDSLSYEAQIRELTHRLQGMTALADFLLANLERATGRDGQAFLQSVAEQADQYFPT
jgi:hypothetical protein